MHTTNNADLNVPYQRLTAATLILQPDHPHLTPEGLAVLLERREDPPDDELLTRSETVSWTKISLSTLDRLIQSGDLKALRIRNSVRIRKSDVCALLRNSAIKRSNNEERD